MCGIGRLLDKVSLWIIPCRLEKWGFFCGLGLMHEDSARCFQDKHVFFWAARAAMMKDKNLLAGPREGSTSSTHCPKVVCSIIVMHWQKILTYSKQFVFIDIVWVPGIVQSILAHTMLSKKSSEVSTGLFHFWFMRKFMLQEGMWLLQGHTAQKFRAGTEI